MQSEYKLRYKKKLKSLARGKNVQKAKKTTFKSWPPNVLVAGRAKGKPPAFEVSELSRE